MRRFVLIVCLVMVFFILVKFVEAMTTDSCIIYVTPMVSYSVYIDTGMLGGVFDFGSMLPGEVRLSTGAVSPSSATIYNNGDVTSDWQIRAVPLDTWTLTSRGNSKNDVGLNRACLAGILGSSTTSNGSIYDISFEDADIIDSSWSNMDSFNFSYTSNGNDVQKFDRRLFWLRLRSASDTTVTEQQRFRIDIKAVPSATF